MDPVKVVVTGPFGAGKTTFIRTISEITVLSTEKSISDETAFDAKHETTVAIDFGRITIAEDLVLYLFGTPGQERFEFMWDVVSRGMLGYIVLVDASRPESFAEASRHAEFFRNAGGRPFVVAANRARETTDVRPAVQAALGLEAPELVVPVDALDRESVKGALVALLEQVLWAVDGRAALAG